MITMLIYKKTLSMICKRFDNYIVIIHKTVLYLDSFVSDIWHEKPMSKRSLKFLLYLVNENIIEAHSLSALKLTLFYLKSTLHLFPVRYDML